MIYLSVSNLSTIMDIELCFICAVKIGRGNRSEIGTQEKMDKLVSVQKTVDHSRYDCLVQQLLKPGHFAAQSYQTSCQES